MAEDACNASPEAPFDLAFSMPRARRIVPGELIDGVVVSIGAQDVFVDVGTKAEGTIDKKEVLDAEGNCTVKVGDTVRVYIVALEPELVLSYSLGRSQLNAEMLQNAYELGVPVDGKVTGVNKGGLDVALGGARAFCPVSQIALDYCEDSSAFVGQTLTFRITKIAEDGRNIVVSRRALLAEEQALAAEETRAELQEGAEFLGEVKTLQPYGAFIAFGGLQGMVHISEISYRRIEHPAEVLAVGQQVRVRVTKVERDPKHPDRERIALSIRALLGDPWEEDARALREGDEVTGKVVRIQPFGAFVQIVPGVDGLIHISELSDRRIKHPNEVVSLGQDVKVTVLKVDTQARRLSLSLQRGEDTATQNGQGAGFAVGSVVDVIVDRVKPFGLLVQIKGQKRAGRGLIPAEETGTGRHANLRRAFAEGAELRAMVTAIEPDSGKVRLSLVALADHDERESYTDFVQTGSTTTQATPTAEAGLGTLGDKLMAALNRKK